MKVVITLPKSFSLDRLISLSSSLLSRREVSSTSHTKPKYEHESLRLEVNTDDKVSTEDIIKVIMTRKELKSFNEEFDRELDETGNLIDIEYNWDYAWGLTTSANPEDRKMIGIIKEEVVIKNPLGEKVRIEVNRANGLYLKDSLNDNQDESNN